MLHPAQCQWRGHAAVCSWHSCELLDWSLLQDVLLHSWLLACLLWHGRAAAVAGLLAGLLAGGWAGNGHCRALVLVAAVETPLLRRCLLPGARRRKCFVPAGLHAARVSTAPRPRQRLRVKHHRVSFVAQSMCASECMQCMEMCAHHSRLNLVNSGFKQSKAVSALLYTPLCLSQWYDHVDVWA